MAKPNKKLRRPPKSPPSNKPLELRNPHAVLAALEARADDVLEVRIDVSQASAAWQRVIRAAERCGRPVVAASPVSQKPVRDDRRTTLATALVRPKREVSLRDVLADECESGVWLALEHVQDPHNLGAIVRTASFFGVRGLILTKDQSASMTPIAYDIGSGGIESIPFVTVTNLSRTIDAAKDAGLWTLGTSEHAEDLVSDVQPDRRWLVIVGNEEQGLRRLTKEKCDAVVAIPCFGAVTSLNVSVATGIVLSQVAGGRETADD